MQQKLYKKYNFVEIDVTQFFVGGLMLYMDLLIHLELKLKFWRTGDDICFSFLTVEIWFKKISYVLIFGT